MTKFAMTKPKPTSTASKPQIRLSAKKQWLFRGVLLLFVWGLLEVVSFCSLAFLDTRYPMDPLAAITQERVESFLKTHYDPVCGWISPKDRPDVNSLGARSLHEYDNLPQTISVYGDSWAYGLGLPVADSWPMLLEKAASRGVLNFGVNGYGTDQALLRLEDIHDTVPSSIVLLCITVENINRCVNIHKAFYQAQGFAPKPRFVLSQNGMELLNPFDERDKVRDITLQNPDKLVSLARDHDYWFPEMTLWGKPWSISFPYSVQLCARIPFLARRVRIGMTDVSSHTYLYHDEETFAVMQGVVRRFRDYAEEKDFTGLVVIFPTLRDVRRYLATDEIGYQPLRGFLASEGIPFVDLLEPFARDPDYPRVFLHRKHHLSRVGSEIATQNVLRLLTENHVVRAAHEARSSRTSPAEVVNDR
jgi:hypothetical protein